MDPYEYLFEMLDIQIIDYVKYRDVWFKNQFIDIFPIRMSVKEIFQYYTYASIHIDEQCRIPMENSCKISSSDLIRILRQFPAELESKEHVDLLLTLHGMNKET